MDLALGERKVTAGYWGVEGAQCGGGRERQEREEERSTVEVGYTEASQM